MSLKCISQSERIHFEKALCCIILLIWHSGKDKKIEAGNKSVVIKRSGVGVEERIV